MHSSLFRLIYRHPFTHSITLSLSSVTLRMPSYRVPIVSYVSIGPSEPQQQLHSYVYSVLPVSQPRLYSYFSSVLPVSPTTAVFLGLFSIASIPNHSCIPRSVQYCQYPQPQLHLQHHTFIPKRNPQVIYLEERSLSIELFVRTYLHRSVRNVLVKWCCLKECYQGIIIYL